MVGGTLRNLRAATAGKVNIVNIYMDIYASVGMICLNMYKIFLEGCMRKSMASKFGRLQNMATNIIQSLCA